MIGYYSNSCDDFTVFAFTTIYQPPQTNNLVTLGFKDEKMIVVKTNVVGSVI